MYFMSNNFFPPENRAVYELMWISMVQRNRPQMTAQRMRLASSTTKAINTQNMYLLFYDNNGHVNAAQRYVTSTLPVLCIKVSGLLPDFILGSKPTFQGYCCPFFRVTNHVTAECHPPFLQANTTQSSSALHYVNFLQCYRK
jgi:hypothetical protein